MLFVTQFYRNENNSSKQQNDNSEVRERGIVTISRHFLENAFIISGKENYKEDEEIFIAAATGRYLVNLNDCQETCNRLNFKIRKCKVPALDRSSAVEYFMKRLPRFQNGDSGIDMGNDLCESNDGEDNIISSQHFVSSTYNEKTCINFKTKKRINNYNISPLAHFTPKWISPRSPHALIEEEFSENPWALLVATIFLNKTTGLKAKPMLWKFLYDYPDPISVAWANVSDLEAYFKNLGLVKRASMIRKMSREFLEGKWKNAGDLHGVGQYGEDAYRIFCLAEINFEPCDRYLRLYVDWLNRRDYNEVYTN